MRLWAISDLHLSYPENREAVESLPAYPEDWLIVAGDVGETLQHAAWAWRRLKDRFARVIWTPGNHDLWSIGADSPRGEALYRAWCLLAEEFGVLTPEDPWPTWQGEGGPCLVAPIFTLYDYGFAPDGLSPEAAVSWAREEGIVCADERFLFPDPYPDRAAWCKERCRVTEERLIQASGSHPLVIVGHFPLRRDLVHLPRVPRFAVWCGTRRTEDWAERFGARVVVSGHLHLRSTELRHGVRYEEVSLGYPSQWQRERGLAGYLRPILPGPEQLPADGDRVYFR